MALDCRVVEERSVQVEMVTPEVVWVGEAKGVKEICAVESPQ